MAFNVRTIFLAVRGTYQAGSAMRLARTDLDKMVKKQKEAAKATQEMVRQSYNIIFAGAAFMAFGAMVTKSLMKVMEASNAGRRVLFRFSRSTQASMRRLSRAIAPIMETFLNLFAKILEVVSTTPLLRELIAVLLVVAGPLLMISGAIVLVGGSVRMLGAMLSMLGLRAKTVAVEATVMKSTLESLTAAAKRYNTGVSAAAAGTQVLNTSVKTLTSSLSMALSVFMIVINVVTSLRNIISGKGGLGDALSLVGTALGAIGGFLLAGPLGAAVGGSVGGTMGGMLGRTIAPPQFAQGTAFVRKGGLAVVHGGEEIKSARETRMISKIEKSTFQAAPTQGGPQKVSHWYVPITIENLYTKASYDDLDLQIKRSLKDYLDDKV